MVYDLDAQKLVVKAIGTVESNLNYLAVNYNDPITVGIFQWYGTRAANILLRFRTENPAAWVGVDATIDADLTAHAVTEASFWNNRYLNRAEGESLVPVMNDNKAIQNDQAFDDLADYLIAANTAGMDEDTSTQQVLFFFVMYHQSPQRAFRVIASVGPSASLASIVAACLNEPVLGQYRTRYLTARDIILSGDSSGVDDVPGPVPDPPDGGDEGSGDGQQRPPGPVSYVESVGNNVRIHYPNGSGITAYPNGHGYWMTRKDEGSGADVPPNPDNPDPEIPPDNPDSAAKRDAVVAFITARIDQYDYSQGPTRLEPDKNNYTDCSGLVYYAYQEVLGINIGTYTGDQYNKPITIAEGFGSTPFPEGDMLKADLIFYNLPGGVAGYVVDHVEMYIGGGEICGHGGPGKGPFIKDLQTAFGSRLNWYVRRVIT